MKLYEKIKCPICKSLNFSVLKKREKIFSNIKKIKKFYYSSSDHKLIDQLIKCNKCNFIYLNPRINSNIIFNSYMNTPDKEFIKYNKSRIETFKKNFKKVINAIKIKNKRKFKILDIGTGGGAFLLAGKKLGFNVSGLEPNKWLVNQARKKYKIDIFQGTIEKFKSNKKYDLICFWDVFEHVVDLNITLRICKKLLNSNGYLLLNVPDHGSLARKILRYNWPFYLNVHLYYFEKKTIQKLLAKYNFKLEKDFIHFQKLPLKYILKRASNYFKFFKIIHKIFPKKLNFDLWYNMGQKLYLFKK